MVSKKKAEELLDDYSRAFAEYYLAEVENKVRDTIASHNRLVQAKRTYSGVRKSTIEQLSKRNYRKI